MLTLNVIIIIFYVIERLIELIVSLRNKILLKKESELKVLNKKESFQMKLFHACWFLLLIYESTPKKILTGESFYLVAIILIAAQILRWIAIYTLGRYWSVDVYEMKTHVVINSGPYAYLKHPNYLVVIIEFFFLPLLLGCPVTLVIGSVVNAFILKRRIALEEKALILQGEYEKKFIGKRRFI
jgi:methyltransferase